MLQKLFFKGRLGMVTYLGSCILAISPLSLPCCEFFPGCSVGRSMCASPFLKLDLGQDLQVMLATEAFIVAESAHINE